MYYAGPIIVLGVQIFTRQNLFFLTLKTMMKAGSRAPGIDQTCLRLTTPAAAFGTFYPRDATLARVFARATCPSVCPVRLSHAGVASKPARRYTSAI